MWRGTAWDLATRPVGLIHLMLSRFLFLIQMPWFTDASGLGEGGGPGGSGGGRIVDGSINYMRDPGDCSLLMHSIYGLNHYPNYLLRWDANSIEDLKNSLERELENVKHQQRRAMLRDEAALSFRGPIEPISDLAGFIDPRFVEAWGPGGTLRPSVLRGLIEEVCDGVYTFPLLDPVFCERLIQHGDAFTRFANEKGVSQLVGAERPLVLDTMKLGWLNNILFEHVVVPVSRILLPDQTLGYDLDWRHGYIVGYEPKESGEDAPSHPSRRSRLVPHTDDSEVTLNVCLGRDFEGGELKLLGSRGGGKEMSEEATISPRVGYAVLHAGRKLHEVLPVTGGERFALIMWARSVQHTRREVCPCCWMNGRDAVSDKCVSGPVWNRKVSGPG